MSKDKSFYITTTLPYVNSDPHIGFAMEIIRADTVARWKRSEGFDVFFNTGTDEHGMKIYQKAFNFDQSPQEYVDKAVLNFKNLKGILNLGDDLRFIRTTDSHHIEAAQEFWRRCDKNGYIYKKQYKAKYCVGCELEKTDSEIENGRCFIHQNLDLEIIEEENYFFKFSEFQESLLELYENNPDFVMPDSRFNEIKAFVQRGLEDFSISRLKEKMPWGVPVPGDDNHVMYVWFDALVNYVSTLGWPENQENFQKYWENGTPVQYCGKDNLRQQSAMWQAMLMAAGLSNSDKIIINGFINSAGQKMSKSLGNVISPYEVVEKYGTDATRYLLLRHVHPHEDTDVTWEKLNEWYEAGLANGLGNLTARIMKLAETNLPGPVEINNDPHKTIAALLDNFELQKAVDHIWEEIGKLDLEIQEKKPWETKDKEVISEIVKKLAHIGFSLSVFMPETSSKILAAILENKMPQTLFPRKDA